MIQLDLAALRTRFFTSFSASDPQVLWLGKPSTNVNESKPFCRLVIEPGASELIEQGVSRTYLQLGLISLSVTLPKGVGLAAGYDELDKFTALFRDWRSEDRAVSIGGSTDTIMETDTQVVLRRRFRWESSRATQADPDPTQSPDQDADPSLDFASANNSGYLGLL